VNVYYTNPDLHGGDVIVGNSFTTVATLTLPAGSYSILATVSIGSFTGSYANTCSLFDSAHGGSAGAPLSNGFEEDTTANQYMTIIGATTASESDTLTLQCIADVSGGEAEATFAQMIATQVTNIITQ
jgi:hypothetical protein